MANNKDDDAPTPGFDPKPVHIGGESLADRIVPHIQKIMAVVGVATLLVSIVLIFRCRAQVKAEDSTSAVISALRESGREVAAPGSTPAAPDGDAPPPFASRQERADAALARLRRASGDPRSSAALLEADLLFEADRLDDAAARYQKLSTRSGIEGVVARESLGYVREAQGQLEAALEAFRAMQPDDAGPRREHALYHQGRILAQLGNKDEARAAFEAALDKAKELGSSLESAIESRLVLLDAPIVTMRSSETKPGVAADAPDQPAPEEEPATP
jgi:tetratricopeptide (TPR) repeat protein